MRSFDMLDKTLKTPARICFPAVLLQLLILHFSFGVSYGSAYPAQDEEPRQPLGSFSTTGEVYLNSAAAPAEATVSAHDLLRTSGTGTATFTLAGNGSLRISPNTEVLFAGEPQYAAELKFGKVVMNSLDGPMGISLRAGSSVVVAVAEGEQSTSSIEAPSDGSFLISCLRGSVGVIPLQGGKGIFIRGGQSVTVSPQGEISAMGNLSATNSQQPASPSLVSAGPEPTARRRHSYARWILIAAGAAGVATAAAILSANGSGASTNTPVVVSPSHSPAISGSVAPPANNAPAPSPVPPSQPTPPQPEPPSPQPPSQPDPGGNGCHKQKDCKPSVVIGFALHF
jgi:hypothetical protein